MDTPGGPNPDDATSMVGENMGRKGTIRFRHPGLRDLVKHRSLYALTLPAVVWTFIFCYLPMIGIVIAFENFDPFAGMFHSSWVGLQNFRFFFEGQDWLRIVVNTVYLNALFIVSGTVASLVIALVMTELGKNVWVRGMQTFMTLPNFISWPIVGLFSVAFFSTNTGVINQLFKHLSLHQVDFYANASVWPWTFMLINVWKGAGFGAIIYMAAIVGFDREFYEAAKIDGASRMQCILQITLPLLRPTIVILFILSLGNVFRGNLDMIYSLIGDNSLLYATTDVIDTYVFRALRTYGSMGMTAAIGLFQSALGFVLVLLSNALVKKVDEGSSIF